MDKQSMLEKAIALAVGAHTGQRDLADEPYILHPLRVMGQMKDPESRIIAVLHDVLEDTKLTAQDLIASGIAPKLVKRVEMLTRGTDEKYQDYIERISQDGWTHEVKMADLNDNLDPNRIHALFYSEKYSARSIERRVAKYLKAWSFLKDND